MKNQYILGIITGASLMLALMVLSGADDDDFRYEIVYNTNGAPTALFDKVTCEVYKNSASPEKGKRVWVSLIPPLETE